MNNTSGVTIALAALVPLVLLMLTSFVKVSVVLALLRNAIGAPEAPSGLVVMGVSLVLTFFVMAPVAIDMVTAAAEPAPGAPGGASPGTAPTPGTRATDPAGATGANPGGATGANPGGATGANPAGATGANSTPSGAAPSNRDVAPPGAPGAKPDLEAAVRSLAGPDHQRDVDRAVRAVEPLRAFLTKHASERDRETFAATSKQLGRATTGNETWVLAPAFLATELREAFAIAVLIFIPFLVIDLVVGLGLAALGLQSTSPDKVALPLKLLLFVSIDGWRLLLDSLLRGYV